MSTEKPVPATAAELFRPIPIDRVIRYHVQTKHHFNRYARALGYLDWANQPDPFRRFEGAPLIPLPLLKPDEEPVSPAYDAIYQPGAVACQPVTVRSLSRFFEFALALSAWKKGGEMEWALRSNPSSGNLHPTEGYLVLPQIDGLDLKARVSIITRQRNMDWSYVQSFPPNRWLGCWLPFRLAHFCLG